MIQQGSIEIAPGITSPLPLLPMLRVETEKGRSTSVIQ